MKHTHTWSSLLSALAAVVCLLAVGCPSALARRRAPQPAPAAVRPPLSPAEQARFDALYYAAITLHQAGATDQAYVLYQRALELDSLSAPTLFALSADLYALGRLPEALAFAERALRSDTTAYWYNRETAILLRALGRDDEAAGLYRRMARLQRTKSDPLYDLADIYLRQDSFDLCLQALNRIEELDGPDPRLSLQRHLILQRLGREDEAFRSFDLLIQRYPYDLDHRILKGDMQMKAGRFADAKQTYDQAARIEPDNAYLWVALSNYYTVMGQPVAADSLVHAALLNPRLDTSTKIEILTEYLKTALRDAARLRRQAIATDSVAAGDGGAGDGGVDSLAVAEAADPALSRLSRIDTLFQTIATMHPTEAAVHTLHADYLSAIDRDDEALHQMRLALDLRPADADYWGTYLALAVPQLDSLALFAACDEAQQALPDSYLPHMFRAFAHSRFLRHHQAARAFLQAIALVPPEETNLKSQLWGFAGDALHQAAVQAARRARRQAVLHPDTAAEGAGRRRADQLMQQAYAAYDDALRYNPQNYLVLNNYAYFLALEGRDLHRAESMAARVVKQNPESETYLDTYAWIYFRQGNYTLARFYQEQALRHAGAHPEASLLEHYGDILIADGREDDALAQWQLALDALDPHDPDQQDAIPCLRRKIAERRYIPEPPDWQP